MIFKNFYLKKKKFNTNKAHDKNFNFSYIHTKKNKNYTAYYIFETVTLYIIVEETCLSYRFIHIHTVCFFLLVQKYLFI